MDWLIDYTTRGHIKITGMLTSLGITNTCNLVKKRKIILIHTRHYFFIFFKSFFCNPFSCQA